MAEAPRMETWRIRPPLHRGSRRQSSLICHKQFADTYQEANGLLDADRTAKIPIADIARAARAAGTAMKLPEREGNEWET